MERLISPAQLKMLWSLAHKNGMSADDLHERVYKQTRCKSLKALSKIQAAKLIDGLGWKKDTGSCITAGQRAAVKRLFAEMGWDETRQTAFVSARYGIKKLDKMHHADARKLIEALKAMIRGGRIERQKAEVQDGKLRGAVETNRERTDGKNLQAIWRQRAIHTE